MLLTHNISVSQTLYPQYNPQDSTFTFSFLQSLEIAKTKKQKVTLEKEVKILNELGGQNEVLIKKLMYKDSLCQIEVKHYENMNELLVEKIDNTNLIVDNYKKNLDEVKNELDKTRKDLRKERFWKNIYKFGTPVLGGLLFFILK